jgi:hypothetical protein
VGHLSIASLEDEASEHSVSPWEHGDQAENELRWLFCQSGGELGERSAWNALVTMAQIGGHQGTRLEAYIDGEVTAPVPTQRQIWAAERQNRYRAALRSLPKPHQAVLERKYSNGRPNAQIKGLLSQQDADHLEPVVTFMLERGDIRIKTDGTDAELPSIIAQAGQFLEGALEGYREARGLKTRLTKSFLDAAGGTRPRRRRSEPSELVAAGTTGASKRRLVPVEAPRKSRP